MWCRVAFLRGEQVKYISHLDLMRVFERAARRGNIPICYSEGFNPRPRFVFGLPLSVGVVAEEDYLDMEIGDADVRESEEGGTTARLMGDIRTRLNEVLPEGIRILQIKEKTAKTNIMAMIKAAVYTIRVSVKDRAVLTEIPAMTELFLSQPEIFVEKKEKKQKKGRNHRKAGSREGKNKVDIRPLIYRIEAVTYTNTDERPHMEGNEKTDGNASLGYFDMNVFVSAGMEKNLRPDVLMNAFQEICRQEGNAFEIESISVVRNAVYTKAETEGEDFISPMHEAALCSGDANSGNGPGSTGLLRDAAGNDKSS